MAIFVESPTIILAVGAIATLFCGIVFLVKRSLRALLILAGVILVTLLLLGIERWVVTEREQVEQALTTVLAAVEANEMQTVVAWVDPVAANLRADVKLLMPKIKVASTGAMDLNIDVDRSQKPHRAKCLFRGKLLGIHIQTGMQVLYFDKVELHWVKRGPRWLLENFVAYQKGKPLKAVEDLRSKHPAPTGI